MELLCVIGLITMFVLVAVAISLFIISGNKVKDYQFFETEYFETAYGVTGMVKEKKKKFQDAYFKYNLAGILLCVLSVVPLFIGIFSRNILYSIIDLSIMFVTIATGVFLIVYACCKMEALICLLQEGEYLKVYKSKSPLMKSISACY